MSRAVEYTLKFIGDEIWALLRRIQTVELTDVARYDELMEIYLEAGRAHDDTSSLYDAVNAAKSTPRVYEVQPK